MTRRSSLRVAAILPVILLAAAMPTSVAAEGRSAAAAEFPAGDARYHTYAEMSQVVASTAAAHPNIVRRFSIGKSYQGRAIWAVKISDNPNLNESEPEILFDGLHHADEHMSTEMTLAILRWLTDGYGTDAEVKRLVDSREIFIVFIVNPDGAVYDISGGKYHFWRKNRQPTPSSSYIGTDLNRNYDYRWGCCGRVSTNPAAITYRGPSAFSAPEARVMRDFVNSRIVGGRQQIRTHITFHTAGRLVMWPYGYTLTDVPGDMTVDDQRTFVSMGRYMAASNGYKPEQASDLYLTSGTFRDWLYGRHRVFSFTFELTAGDYPADETIAAETGRNRRAALYMIDLANCPQRAIGKALDYCGPFFDDLEIGRGWSRDPRGTDTATSGVWTTGDPEPTATAGGPKQLGSAYSGSRTLVTGRLAGGTAGANDVDGGITTARSPHIALPTTGTSSVRFRYYFAHDARSSSADYLKLRLIGSSGQTVLFMELGGADDDDAAWAVRTVAIPPSFYGQVVQLQFEAADGGSDSLVEAGVDDVAVIRP